MYVQKNKKNRSSVPGRSNSCASPSSRHWLCSPQNLLFNGYFALGLIRPQCEADQLLKSSFSFKATSTYS